MCSGGRRNCCAADTTSSCYYPQVTEGGTADGLGAGALHKLFSLLFRTLQHYSGLVQVGGTFQLGILCEVTTPLGASASCTRGTEGLLPGHGGGHSLRS